MKILIVGGKGTIGSTVVSYFSENNKVIIAGRNSGDVTVDITSESSIKDMFESVGKLDAIISIAGEAKWAAFNDLTESDFHIGLNSKLMGQVNLVRVGKDYLSQGGSITLTTGILADDPVKMTTSAAMVNGGIHSFVKAVALEMENGIRVNVVSPGLVQASAIKYKDYFPGHIPISMEQALSGFVKSVEGAYNGKVIRIYN